MLKKNVPSKPVPGKKPAPSKAATPASAVAKKPAPAVTTAKKPEPPKTASIAPKAPVKQEEPKQEPVAVTSEPSVKVEPRLDTMIRERFNHVKTAEAKLKKLKEQELATKAEIEETLRDVTRLRKIRNMVNLLEQPYMWHMIKRPASELNKCLWSEDYTYKTSAMEFIVELREATNRKRRFVVEVAGKKVAPGINENDLGGVDYNYIRSKYMESRWNDVLKVNEWYPRPEYGVELEVGHETLAEARKALKAWQEKLVADHKDLINEELMLFAECKE